jgi:hypothetical protein
MAKQAVLVLIAMGVAFYHMRKHTGLLKSLHSASDEALETAHRAIIDAGVDMRTHDIVRGRNLRNVPTLLLLQRAAPGAALAAGASAGVSDPGAAAPRVVLELALDSRQQQRQRQEQQRQEQRGQQRGKRGVARRGGKLLTAGQQRALQREQHKRRKLQRQQQRQQQQQQRGRSGGWGWFGGGAKRGGAARGKQGPQQQQQQQQQQRLPHFTLTVHTPLGRRVASVLQRAVPNVRVRSSFEPPPPPSPRVGQVPHLAVPAADTGAGAGAEAADAGAVPAADASKGAPTVDAVGVVAEAPGQEVPSAPSAPASPSDPACDSESSTCEPLQKTAHTGYDASEL